MYLEKGQETPITITLLIKNPNIFQEKATIKYYELSDYLTKNDKLKIISDFKSLKNIKWEILNPNQKGDWINQRNEKFDTFIPLIDKDNKNNKNTFFNFSSSGVVTSRDSWVYSYSKAKLEKQMKDTIKFYNSQIEKIERIKMKDENVKIEEIIDTNPNNISWSRDLKKRANKLLKDTYENNYILLSFYRPFVKEYLYYNKFWNECQYQQDKLKNYRSIVTTGLGGNKNFSVIINSDIINFDCLEKSNCYPLYYNEENKVNTLFSPKENKKDGITDFIYNLAREKYGVPRITKEDIFYYVYGFLHNEDYRKEFEADLKKTVPKLPLVEKYQDFKKYSDIGRELAELHLNYETLERPEGVIVEGEELGNYKVEKMSFIKKGIKDTINYNSSITIKNIPLEAYDYQVNGKSAIEWIMEKYAITINKDSGITNDPNLWCEEHNDPKYILNLLLSIITLSLKTNELVRELPKIKF